jgi:hypothetical protein
VFESGDLEDGPRDEQEHADDEAAQSREPTAWAGEARELSIAKALALSPEGFTYVYDFAEDWRVQVTCQAEADVDTVSVECLDGAHAGPQQESRELDPFTVDAANRRLYKALRRRATPDFPAGPGASPEQQLLANLSLVVLLLGSRPTRHGTREAWKTIRGEILDTLHEAGLIESDPQRKSVTITDAGAAHARRLLQRLRSL